MKYNTQALLAQLEADVREILLQSNELQQVSPDLLCIKPNALQWSVAQILEHLNIYARHYVRAIEQCLHLHQTKPSAEFKPGWLGGYFTRLMKPVGSNTTAKKMKAPKNAQPSQYPNAEAELKEFIGHQHQLLNLLAMAHSANLSKLHIPTSLHSKLRLRLGDSFLFFVAHEQRHCEQIKQTLTTAKAFLYEAA